MVDILEALSEQFGIDINRDEPYLSGKPREYYCDEHGTLFGAVVHDPYDCPSYVCPECGETLSYNKLDKS